MQELIFYVFVIKCQNVEMSSDTPGIYISH